MDIDRLFDLARTLIGELTYCVAATPDGDGGVSARVVQPRRPREDWTVDCLTNRRCRKVREIERAGRMTLLYQHDADHSYVALSGPTVIAEDRDLKRATWTPAHDRWNPTGPEDPATVYMRLTPDRIELWSAKHDVMPPPQGYSAAVLLREADGWRYAVT